MRNSQRALVIISLLTVPLFSACCLPWASGVNFHPSPSYAFLDATGEPIQLSEAFMDSNTLEITGFFMERDQKVEISYEVSDQYGGGEDISLEGNTLLVIDGGEFGALEEGDVRRNELILEYNYQGSSYSDTIWYDSFMQEDCGRLGVIDYDSFSYAGELHVSTERRTDIPGFFITLREP